MAARLAEAGRRVLVVEAGGHRPEAAMPISEAEAWREMLLDRGATSTDDLSFTILAGATLGGGTTVNWTTTIRPPDWLRDEWESAHGLTGLTSAETDADLARLEAELGLEPPTVVPPKDRIILDGARSLGWEADVTMRNAGPCTDCGGCTFGCARGSKRSGLRAHLAMAQARGARILTGARVTRLRHRAGAVDGVVGRLEPGGRHFAIRAPQVVVAAGGLRTPVLLERSGAGASRASAATSASIPRWSSAAGWPSRWTCGSARCRRPAASSSRWPGPAGERRHRSGARRLHHGGRARRIPASRWLRSRGPAAPMPWPGRPTSGTWRRSSRSFATRDRVECARSKGGRARIGYHLDRRDAATARRALVELSRLARAGGAVELVALGDPRPVVASSRRLRRVPGRRGADRHRREPGDTLQRPSDGHGPSREATRAPLPRIRGAACGRIGVAGFCAAPTSPMARCCRPRPASTRCSRSWRSPSAPPARSSPTGVRARLPSASGAARSPRRRCAPAATCRPRRGR